MEFIIVTTICVIYMCTYHFKQRKILLLYFSFKFIVQVLNSVHEVEQCNTVLIFWVHLSLVRAATCMCISGGANRHSIDVYR